MHKKFPSKDSVLACLQGSYLILCICDHLFRLSLKLSNGYCTCRLVVVCAIYSETLLLERTKQFRDTEDYLSQYIVHLVHVLGDLIQARVLFEGWS